MNFYHDYEMLVDTNDCFHYRINESKERLRFVTLRVVPLFLLFLMWFLLQQIGTVIPMAWNYHMIAIVLFISCLLLFRSYIIECKIVNQNEVCIKTKTLFGIQEKRISIANIEKVLLIKKGKNNSFYIETSKPGNKNYRLLIIPTSDAAEQQINMITARLEKLLSAKIINSTN